MTKINNLIFLLLTARYAIDTNYTNFWIFMKILLLNIFKIK